jgi:NAD(P)-dependent dehydrogenase (short-subunit alcohol dehydrogenase family)
MNTSTSPDRSAAGEVVVVFDAASPGPLAVARRFQASGATAVAISHDPAATEIALTEDSPGLSLLGCDLAQADQVKNAFDRVQEAHGRLDSLFIWGSVDADGDTTPEATSMAVYDDIHNRVVRSAFVLSQQALPLLEKSDNGSVVTVASTAALRGRPGRAAFSAAAGALVGFSRALAFNYASRGVRVNILVSGSIDDDAATGVIGRASAATPMGIVGNSADLAGAGLFLSSPDARFITGALITVDGGETI